MKFQYSAFIQNSPQMRKWLKGLGYINLSKCNGEYLLTYDDSNEVGSFDLDFILRAIGEGRNSIDCRKNPSLFKAVTAIRSDNHYNQWFRHEGELSLSEWTLCKEEKFKGKRIHSDTIGDKMIFCYICENCYQKATLAEIIQKFGTEEYLED